MSINIQTANGLVRISGEKITKEKIIESLGYTPADEQLLPNIKEDESGSLCITDDNENIIFKVDKDGVHSIEFNANGVLLGEHAKNDEIHITQVERDLWSNKNYNDLENKPIEEDESGDLKFIDELGNIIFKIDEDGAHTTNVEATNELRAKKLVLDNVDIIETIDDKISTIDDKIDEEIVNVNSQLEGIELVFTGHNTNDDIHVTAEDKNIWYEHIEDNAIHVTIDDKVKWDNKSDFTGNYDSLENKPIEEDGSGDLCITDEFGNIIFKVDKDGVHTTNIHATKINSEETVVQVDIVNGVLTLTDDKYQKTNMVTGTQIEFPEVIGFTEIHLYFDAETDMDLSFPDNCRWRVDSNIEQGKSYEIVATYNTIHWLINIIVYS